MKFYRTTQLVQVAGLVGLSKAQADRRGHRVKATGTDGVYETDGLLDFKAGELVGLPVDDKGQPPKYLWRSLEGGQDGNGPTAFNPNGEPLIEAAAASESTPEQRKATRKAK
jgi:hypothetical protein